MLRVLIRLLLGVLAGMLAVVFAGRLARLLASQGRQPREGGGRAAPGRQPEGFGFAKEEVLDVPYDEVQTNKEGEESDSNREGAREHEGVR